MLGVWAGIVLAALIVVGIIVRSIRRHNRGDEI